MNEFQLKIEEFQKEIADQKQKNELLLKTYLSMETDFKQKIKA